MALYVDLLVLALIQCAWSVEAARSSPPLSSWASIPSPGAPNPQSRISVDSTSGRIIGHAAAHSPLVNEYLGIPFAQPPVGDLRFAAPQPYKSDDTLTADKLPPSCIQETHTINSSQPINWQNIAAQEGSFANHTSEDCLYLNVWISSNSTQELRPVLLWIYGGGFHDGGAADSSQQGSLFAAEQDVMIVNFNYRLGIFGFSGAPGLVQNVGLLDQRMAVEWVRDNAESFGGDPDRITLFGHSAGGASVDLYDHAWISDPIIAGSIPMSGTATSFGNRYANTSAAAWYETAALLGCGNRTTSSDAQILACTRNANASEILQTSQKASRTVAASLDGTAAVYAGITGIFGPTIDNQTVFENYTMRSQDGIFIQKPLLVGSNIDEGCFYAEEGRLPSSDQFLVTEEIFTCPVNWAAIFHAKKGVKTWKYSYEGAFPNMFAPACPGKPWHGQEVNVLFGSTDIVSGESATEQELLVGAYMRSAFAAFASNSTHGLDFFGWPTFDQSTNNAVVLGLNSTPSWNVSSVAVADAPCYTNFTFGAPNF